MSEVKSDVIVAVTELLEALECKLKILEALDMDVTTKDKFDLHDQLATYSNLMGQFWSLSNRMSKICPVYKGEDDE